MMTTDGRTSQLRLADMTIRGALERARAEIDIALAKLPPVERSADEATLDPFQDVAILQRHILSRALPENRAAVHRRVSSLWARRPTLLSIVTADELPSEADVAAARKRLQHLTPSTRQGCIGILESTAAAAGVSFELEEDEPLPTIGVPQLLDINARVRLLKYVAEGDGTMSDLERARILETIGDRRRLSQVAALVESTLAGPLLEELPFEDIHRLVERLSDEERARFSSALEDVATSDGLPGEEWARLLEVRMYLGV